NKLKAFGATPLKEAVKASDLLKRPEINYARLEEIIDPDPNLPEIVKEQVEIQIKYEGYIKKSLEQDERMRKMEDKKIHEDIDYDAINGIANEAREKLKDVRALSVGLESQISGDNPADIASMLVYIEQRNIASVAN